MNNAKRVGCALSHPSAQGRCYVFGVYESDLYGFGPNLHCAHEGYRDADGTMTGLALGGKGWLPPMIKGFDRRDLSEVRFFDGRES